MDEVTDKVLAGYNASMGEEARDSIVAANSRKLIDAAVAEGKLPKDNAEIYVNLPGRIRLELSHDGKIVTSCEMMATEFGRTESLDNELFGKKLFTQLVYHPLSGSIQSIKSEMVKK